MPDDPKLMGMGMYQLPIQTREPRKSQPTIQDLQMRDDILGLYLRAGLDTRQYPKVLYSESGPNRMPIAAARVVTDAGQGFVLIMARRFDRPGFEFEATVDASDLRNA